MPARFFHRGPFCCVLQVQVRQVACNPGAPNPVSCICGIALREDNTILILDSCNDDDIHTVFYSAKNLPTGSGIFADNARLKYKVIGYAIEQLATRLTVHCMVMK
jgi:hypothetical protein